MHMFTLNKIKLSVFILLSLLAQLSYAASNPYQQGMQYFKQEKFSQAADAFRRALDSGDKRAAVYYNLAVSEYRTGNLKRAEKHFRKAAENKRFYPLSQYSLGLIYTKRDRLKTAKKYFSRVKKKDDAALYKRARRMISRIKNEPEKPASLLDDISGLLSFSLGRDDNVNRASDNSPTNVSDNFTSLYASTRLPLSTDKNIGVNASFYNIDYMNLNTDDFNILRAGIYYKTRLQDWRTKTTLSFANSNLGSTGFQKALRLDLSARQKLSRASSLRINYQYDDINSSNVLYDYLEGWRQRLRLTYKTRLNDTSIQARYRLELNSRTDTLTQSFSPTRHTLRGIVDHKLDDKWSIKGDMAYRSSDYPAIGINPGRTENRLQTAIKLRYRLQKNWDVQGMLRFTSNNTDNPIYDYSRNDFYINTSYSY